MSRSDKKSNLSLQSIALPVEHGSWGLLLEPIVLGLLVAPSWAGFSIAIAIFFCFLIRRPLKILLFQRSSAFPERTLWATRLVFGFSGTALSAFGVAFVFAGSRPFLPLAAISPLLVIFVVWELKRQSRQWLPELAGALVFVTVACSIAISAEWPLGRALALSVLLAARAVPSIFFVRTRLRLDREGNHHKEWVLVFHLIVPILVGAMVSLEWVPRMTILPFFLLTARAFWGLSAKRKLGTPQRLGFQEITWGAVTVLLIAIGYWL